MSSFVFSAGPGGTLGRMFTAVVGELVRRGHEVVLLVPPAYRGGEHLIDAGGAEVRAWPEGTRAALAFADEVIGRRRPDAVVGSFSGTNVLLAVGRRRRVPARMAWHHTPALASRLDGARGLRWQYLRRRKAAVLRSATDLLVATERLAEDLRANYGVGAAKVTVEPFAIPDPGGPAAERVPGRLVAVGRLYPVKGLDWLVESLPAGGVELRVLGEGPERGRLEAMAAGRPVRFLGTVGRDDVVRELATADLAIAPSRDEGFGLVTIEAQAVGTPVVASDLPAFRTTVADGETGVLVPVEDRTALREAITGLLADPDRRRAMGEAGRRRFEAHFDLTTRLPELAQTYERLVRARLG